MSLDGNYRFMWDFEMCIFLQYVEETLGTKLNYANLVEFDGKMNVHILKYAGENEKWFITWLGKNHFMLLVPSTSESTNVNFEMLSGKFQNINQKFQNISQKF